MKKHFLNSIVLLIVITIFGCNSNSKSNNNSGSTSSEIIEDQDKYVGNWLDISGQVKEPLKVTKPHDGEYQLGGINGHTKISNGGQEFIYGTVSNQVEVQFIYDNTTSHLIMRSPLFNIEYRKLSGEELTKVLEDLKNKPVEKIVVEEPKPETQISNEDTEKPYVPVITYYKILDPDGYSNLRKDPNGEIIRKVYDTERFEVIGSDHDFKKVKFSDGTTGYISRSRVVLVQ